MGRSDILPPPPDERVVNLVVLLLRSGLGIQVLNAGLLGYLSARVGSMPPGLHLVLPYLQIGLGLALILGLFSTIAALGTGFLYTFQPLIHTAILLGGGYQGMMRGPLNEQLLTEWGGPTGHLLLSAVVLWFSPLGRNRWSADRLFFGRQGPQGSPIAAPLTPLEDLPAAPAPGERTAAFLDRRTLP